MATGGPSLTTGTPGPPLVVVDRVVFLGLELISGDAEVALYIVFALVLVSVVAAILGAYRLSKTKQQLKRTVAGSLRMQKM
ncbi:unnamed protein product [Lota lota]